MRRLGLTDSTFSVQVRIQGVTNVRRLSVSYIAIDPLFPHHLNSFDNVEADYPGLVPLTNVTTHQSLTTTYHNTVNYTQQAAGMGHKIFYEPFENIKILLFMTSLNIEGTNKCVPPLYEVDLNVNAVVMSIDTYLLEITLRV